MPDEEVCYGSIKQRIDKEIEEKLVQNYRADQIMRKTNACKDSDY